MATIKTIDIKIKSNATEAAAQMKELANATREAANATSDLNAQQAQANGEAQMSETAQATKEALDKAAEAALEYQKALGRIQAASGTAGAEIKNAASSFKAVVGQASDKLKGIGQKMDETAKKKPFDKATKSASGFLAKMGKLAVLKLMRTMVQKIFEDMSEGFESMYKYSKEAGTSFAPAMDTLTTDFQYLRNSLVAMLTPLITFITPIVDAVTDMVATVANYANIVFSALNGEDTYTAVLKKDASYLDDADESAKSLKRTLMGFDEINALSDNSGISVSSTGSDTGLGPETELPDWAKVLKDASDETKSFYDVTTEGIILFFWGIRELFNGNVDEAWKYFMVAFSEMEKSDFWRRTFAAVLSTVNLFKETIAALVSWWKLTANEIEYSFVNRKQKFLQGIANVIEIVQGGISTVIEGFSKVAQLLLRVQATVLKLQGKTALGELLDLQADELEEQTDTLLDNMSDWTEGIDETIESLGEQKKALNAERDTILLNREANRKMSESMRELIERYDNGELTLTEYLEEVQKLNDTDWEKTVKILNNGLNDETEAQEAGRTGGLAFAGNTQDAIDEKLAEKEYWKSQSSSLDTNLKSELTSTKKGADSGEVFAENFENGFSDNADGSTLADDANSSLKSYVRDNNIGNAAGKSFGSNFIDGWDSKTSTWWEGICATLDSWFGNSGGGSHNFAVGGFPEQGTMFFAGEAGAEIVTSSSHGTGVINIDQLTYGVQQGVINGLASSGGGSTSVVIKMDSGVLARANLKGRNAMNRQFNLSLA